MSCTPSVARSGRPRGRRRDEAGLDADSLDHESTKGRKHETETRRVRGERRSKTRPFRAFVLSCFRDLGTGDGTGRPSTALLVIVAAFAGTGSAADDDANNAAPGRMFVVGRVLDPDGQPVPNATIMVHAALRQPGRGGGVEDLSPTSIGQARSDGSGRFRLDASRTTSARDHEVGAVALAPGYGAGWIEFDPDADQPAADITLRPEQVIEGRLFDLNGRPVRDAEVTVQDMGRAIPSLLAPLVPDSIAGPSFSPFHGSDLPAWPRPAFSDADGRFTLRGVGRGLRVVLAIHDPRFALTRARIDTDGASRSKAVTLALEPARIFAGRVTDAEADRPIPHARFVVVSWKGGLGTFNRFDADDQGRFRINPPAAERYDITVSSMSGPPYLDASTSSFVWPKGTVEHRVDYALHRGVPIRGKVVEEGTGRPVAGARVSFRSTRMHDETTGDRNSHAATVADGSFRLAVLPAPGYLVVLGPTDDYVYRSIGGRVVEEGKPGGPRFSAHALVPYEAKYGVEGPEVTVSLRRGETVAGRVVGPDGRTIPSAAMIGRILLAPSLGGWRFWNYAYKPYTRDGRFAVHGLDPDAEVPIHFIAAEEMLGATAMLSGKSAANGPVTVRLEPCGAVRARLVDRGKKPVAGFRGSRLIAMIVTPGPSRGDADQQDQVNGDSAAVLAIDPTHYADGPGPVSDADGWVALPALIPGATYRVQAGPRRGPPTFRKDFTVKPGEMVNLGEIVVERPPR
jgi:hypothetical protein